MIKSGNATKLLDYSNISYISLVEAGSILEDALFPEATTIPKVKGCDGRFNNHFYSAQYYSPKREFLDSLHYNSGCYMPSISSRFQ